MGQNPRRPGFRLRWGEAERTDEDAAAEAAAAEAASRQDAPAHEASATEPAAEQPASEQATAEQAEATQPTEPASAAMPDSEVAKADAAPTQTPGAAEDVPFLRDLVGAMRGVAESSRDSSLETARKAVEERVAELTASAAERAEELRRTADLDVNGIGEWERTELERIRREAEKRREARRAELEKQLAEHQSATDEAVEATRARLADHERELDAFFAQLSEISDPAAFVAAAKRMPQAPDLAKPAEAAATGAAETKATPLEPKSATNGSPATTGPSDETLAQRLAQLDQRLSQGAPSPETAASPAGPAAAEASAADVPPATPESPATVEPAASNVPAAVASGAGAATAVEISTAIVVKGLGSFGAITSFKQALERVNGIRGVTLSLGPTGDFVYRASHASDFDLSGAIRSIEGPNVGIEESDGSLVVTIAGPR